MLHKITLKRESTKKPQKLHFWVDTDTGNLNLVVYNEGASKTNSVYYIAEPSAAKELLEGLLPFKQLWGVRDVAR